MNPEIYTQALDGVVSARQNPHLVRALNSCHHRGELARLLPGVYTLPHLADDWNIRIQAVRAYGDDLVATRRAAAVLNRFPGHEPPQLIELATPRQLHAAPGYSVEQRWIRPELLTRRAGVLTTTPALTVLDLMDEGGAAVVDDALRNRVATLAQLKGALSLSAGRRGNTARREILEDSRDQPWSPLERDAHRHLRAARITGWATNYRVEAEGAVYFIDIALPELKLGLEIDGETHHSSSDAFHSDRIKGERLSRAGWQMVHFTKRSVPGIALSVMELIEQRQRLLRPNR